MQKRDLLVLACIFLFFYLLNHFMPMTFGDDYLYAFKWQGNPMFVPLTEDAVRLASLKDLLESQLAFYYTWSGRVVNNSLAQLFAWSGKKTFDIFNAAVSVLLIMELYWCVNKGKVSFNFKASLLCWLVFVFWVFTPRLPSVAFWMVGAFHYLWPAVLLTGFMLPYIRKYYCFHTTVVSNRCFSTVMFCWGMLSGCTNENSGCWIILALTFFIFIHGKDKEKESWMYSGVVGFIIGYMVLMTSPGNYARLISVHGHDWFSIQILLSNLHSFIKVIVWQFILWYFCLRSLFTLNQMMKHDASLKEESIQQDILMVKVLCTLAFLMSVIMLLSPEFHLRSAFPGTVQLIIAAGIVVRMQQERSIEFISLHVKQFLTAIGIIYFCMSAGVTLHHHYEHRLYVNNIFSSVKAMQLSGNDENQVVLCVVPFVKTSRLEDFMSGFHTFENNLSEDKNSWENVAFARYYGIKSIRVKEVEGTVSEKQ